MNDDEFETDSFKSSPIWKFINSLLNIALLYALSAFVERFNYPENMDLINDVYTQNKTIHQIVTFFFVLLFYFCINQFSTKSYTIKLFNYTILKIHFSTLFAPLFLLERDNINFLQIQQPFTYFKLQVPMFITFLIIPCLLLWMEKCDLFSFRFLFYFILSLFISLVFPLFSTSTSFIPFCMIFLTLYRILFNSRQLFQSNITYYLFLFSQVLIIPIILRIIREILSRSCDMDPYEFITKDVIEKFDILNNFPPNMDNEIAFQDYYSQIRILNNPFDYIRHFLTSHFSEFGSNTSGIVFYISCLLSHFLLKLDNSNEYSLLYFIIMLSIFFSEIWCGNTLLYDEYGLNDLVVNIYFFISMGIKLCNSDSQTFTQFCLIFVFYFCYHIYHTTDSTIGIRIGSFLESLLRS